MEGGESREDGGEGRLGEEGGGSDGLGRAPICTNTEGDGGATYRRRWRVGSHVWRWAVAGGESEKRGENWAVRKFIEMGVGYYAQNKPHCMLRSLAKIKMQYVTNLN